MAKRKKSRVSEEDEDQQQQKQGQHKFNQLYSSSSNSKSLNEMRSQSHENDTQTQSKSATTMVEYNTSDFDQEVSLNDLVNMIVLHEYPLSMVDHHGFRVFASNLQPLFNMISRKTLESHIMKNYFSNKQKLIKLLSGLDSRVAITTDMWNAKSNKRKFMSVTVHFIDSDWVLQSQIARFINVPTPYSSDVLTGYLVETLMDLNIDRKLCTVTVDNATSNYATLDNIVDRVDPSTLIMGGKVVHMRCCAQVVNSIVNDCLEANKEVIEKVRNSVLFWRPRSRIQKFKDTTRQLSIQYAKCLSLDCPTRWSTTYIMLETALLYKAVFLQLKVEEKLYTCSPDEEEWRRVEKITKKLKLFYGVTEMFSSTSCPMINDFFLKACSIKLSLNKWAGDSDTFTSEMAKKMIEKYDKYWGECHVILEIACVLDPRYKLIFMEFFLPKIYGEFASIEIEKIRNGCYDLLDEYQSKGRVSEKDVVGSSSLSLGFDFDPIGSLSRYDEFIRRTSKQVDVKSELDYYLGEYVLPRTANFDVLGWWKTNGVKYPTLQKIARDILVIPVSSVASDSAFNTNGRLISPHRSRLSPSTLEAIMFTQNWLQNENKGLPSQAESMETLASCHDDIDVDEMLLS